MGEAWHGFATEGVMTRTIRDMARFLDVIAGRMPGDPYSPAPPPHPYNVLAERSPGKVQIGVLTTMPWGRGALHEDCAAAVSCAVTLLEEIGHSVEAEYPAAYDESEFFLHFMRAINAHAASTLDAISATLGRELGPEAVETYTWSFIEEGRKISAAEYIGSFDWIQAFSRRMAEFWAGGFDLLLTPTLAAPPPKLGTLTNPDEHPATVWERNLDLVPFTPVQNATGQPAISLPLHWNEEGLPIGVQLVADYGREDLLLQVARQLEEASPWVDKVPPIHG
jgi:amidase